MCGCDFRKGPHGVPLDDIALMEMADEEKQFWMDFLGQASKEISEADGRDEGRPFVPSASLRQKHKRAIKEFGDEVYCQMGQLGQIFDFSPPS
jgi:hypothetical protein